MVSERAVSRRRFVALSVGALTTLAGCPTNGDTGQSTNTAQTDTDVGTTTTETATETATPTSTPGAFSDDFSNESLDRYRSLAGSLDQWSITSKIDGPSALVDTTERGSESLIAPTGDALTWPGTGRVSADVQFDAEARFRNCTIAVGAVPSGSAAYVQIGPQQLLISAPNGDFSQRFPDIGADGVHQVTVTLTTGTVRVTVDEEHTLDVGVDEPLPAGTVAFGIEAGRATSGGRTWFDNVAVAGDR